MTDGHQHQHTDPRLFERLQRDIKEKDIWEKVRREFQGLRAFFVDEERRRRLAGMNPFVRWLAESWWIFEGMLLRLTPVRRLLLLLGVILLLIGNSIRVEGADARFEGGALLGGALVLVVLMLELKDRILATDELEAGRQVQRAFMPPRTPAVEGWSIWLFTRPANEVGGDLVDYMRIGEGRHAMIIADVAGKGLRAALLMANLQATLRALASDYASIGRLIGKVNEIFHRNTLSNVFASLLYVEVAPGSRGVRYVNAGHIPPLVIRAESCEQASKGDTALGLSALSVYAEKLVDLEPGDTFIAYSDGLTEARNEAGEFYGGERLVQLVPLLRGLQAESIGEGITAALDRFVGSASASDDLSLVILQKR